MDREEILRKTKRQLEDLKPFPSTREEMEIELLNTINRARETEDQLFYTERLLKKKTISVAILRLVVVALLITSVYFYISKQELSESFTNVLGESLGRQIVIDELEDAIDTVAGERDDALYKLEAAEGVIGWLGDNIGVICPDVKNYHNIFCDKVSNEEIWYMHDVNYCNSILNYAPCPDCW